MSQISLIMKGLDDKDLLINTRAYAPVHTHTHWTWLKQTIVSFYPLGISKGIKGVTFDRIMTFHSGPPYGPEGPHLLNERDLGLGLLMMLNHCTSLLFREVVVAVNFPIHMVRMTHTWKPRSCPKINFLLGLPRGAQKQQWNMTVWIAKVSFPGRRLTLWGSFSPYFPWGLRVIMSQFLT